MISLDLTRGRLCAASNLASTAREANARRFPCVGARARTAAADNHRDGDHSDGGEKPDQDGGLLRAATAMQRLSPARAWPAAARMVAQR